VDNKLNHFIELLNEKLRLFLSISVGIFLFILFFQPFPLNRFDFNDRLLFVAGFGAIVFLLMYLVSVAIPLILQKKNQIENETVFPASLNGFVILILCSVAFAFYLRYIGLVNISFYIMLKVILISLAPPVVLKVYDNISELKNNNELLIIEKKIIQQQIDKFEADNLNKSIEFNSETNTENLTLLVAEVALIKSADNYVEIVYKEGDKLRKKLIRSTLKNIELQLKQYSSFIRCHRVCIVNIHYIEKLDRNFNKHWLTIKQYHEQIPVSRQYLLKLKEAL
jgi:hypothetical protein